MNQFARPGLGVTELPSFNENDKGKVLKIDSETGVLGWGEAGGSGLPSTDAASAGDVLSLDNSKDPQWSAPSSGGGVLVVHENVTTVGNDTICTLDKTWQEIHDADFAVLKMNNGMIYYASDVGVDDDDYYVVFMYNHPVEDGYSCDSASGYPSYSEGK